MVRGIGARRDPWTTLVSEILSAEDIATASPDTPVHEVVELMRAKAVRRLPVVEKGRLIGIVSLGDLAIEEDPQSALAHVSGASANR